MNREEIRQAVTSQFYQTLAETGVEITAIPQAQLQTLVTAIADGVFAALDAVEEESGPEGMLGAADEWDESDQEELLWTGRPYLSIGIRYELTTQRVRQIRGLLGRTYNEIELVRVRDTEVTQHIGERALNIGDVKIISNDPSDPVFVLHNIRNPMEVRELIRKATLQEKKRRGLHYREEM